MKLHEAIRLTIEMEDESFITDDRFINYLADMHAQSETPSQWLEQVIEASPFQGKCIVQMSANNRLV